MYGCCSRVLRVAVCECDDLVHVRFVLLQGFWGAPSGQTTPRVAETSHVSVALQLVCNAGHPNTTN